MSVGRFLQQGAAGNAGEAVYVDDVFSTYLYDGNGGVQTINNGIDLDGEGGMLWIKNRTGGYDHAVVGPDISGFLRTNRTNSLVSTDQFTFNNNGFTIDGAAYMWNDSSLSSEYASWTFRKQPGFFDVVTYTGNSTAGHTIPHNLGTVPGMIIIKWIDTAGDWSVYHRGMGNETIMRLNSTAGTSSYGNSVVYFNNTDPTSTEFTLGASSDMNLNGYNYVAYLFAHDAQDFGTDSDESIIKCGSYTGNGSAAGPEIDLGWEPQWVMIKSTGGAYGWIMHDTMRGWTADGKPIARLRADQGGAEYNDANYTEVAVTPTGFRLTNNHPSTNGSGIEYIYVAIRRPHKPAEEFAATDLFALDTGANTEPGLVSDFPVDFSFSKEILYSNTWYVGSRLLGQKYMSFASTTTESTRSAITWDYMNGFMDSSFSGEQGWMFRRAPGFFDVVAYTGDGTSSHAISHNLGVTPEFMIVKSRSFSSSWYVWESGFAGTSDFIFLNFSNAKTSASTVFPSDPTSSNFTVGSSAGINSSGNTFIAYLFATVPGISKVGRYTGTGADLDVDCGFTSGARFVLVKRTDSTGDWYVWDSERGIVAGNDPYLLLNTTAAEAASTDYIDPLSSGFTITSSAPAALNASGGSYLFLAIA